MQLLEFENTIFPNYLIDDQDFIINICNSLIRGFKNALEEREEPIFAIVTNEKISKCEGNELFKIIKNSPDLLGVVAQREDAVASFLGLSCTITDVDVADMPDEILEGDENARMKHLNELKKSGKGKAKDAIMILGVSHKGNIKADGREFGRGVLDYIIEFDKGLEDTFKEGFLEQMIESMRKREQSKSAGIEPADISSN